MGKLNSAEKIVYSAYLTLDITSLFSCRFSIAGCISEQKVDVTDRNVCISKCRELILIEPQILAYPVLGSRRDIVVIMSQVSFTDKAFRDKLSVMGLEIISYNFADKQALEKAVKFTLLTRLAPEWNSVGKFFIAGQHFLQNTEPSSAISFEIFIQDNEIQFQLQGGNIELFPIRASAFGIPAPLWEAIRQDPCFHISGSKLNIEFAGPFALPSLRKGYVQSISGRIPFVCPYKTYPELCRHWEAVYGYLLPQELGRQFYVTVKFAGGTGIAYTYPSLCIHTKPPAIRDSVNPFPIIQVFTQAIRTKMSFICGNRVEFADIAPFSPFPPLPSKLAPTPSKLASAAPASSRNAPKQKQTKVSQFFAQAKAWGDKWDAEATTLPVLRTQNISEETHQVQGTPLSDLLQQFRHRKAQPPPLAPDNATPSLDSVQSPHWVFNLPNNVDITAQSTASATNTAAETIMSALPINSCAVTQHDSFDSLPSSQPPEALNFPEELTQQIIGNIQSLCEKYEQDSAIVYDPTTESIDKLSAKASWYDKTIPGTYNTRVGPFMTSRNFPPFEVDATFPKPSDTENVLRPTVGNPITQLAMNTLLFSKMAAPKRKEERPSEEINKRPRLE